MPIDHLEAFTHEAATLAAAARKGPTDAPVPGCPGWDVLQVVRHTARTLRMAAFAITEGRPPGRDDLPLAPKDPDAALAFFEEGAEAWVVLLRATPDDHPAWNFLDAPPVAGFWRRRMAHELAVHRWDVESALGAPTAIDAELAADGVDELLRWFLPADAPVGDALPQGSLHVHCSDTEGEWTLRPGPEGPMLDVGHAKGDAAVRGQASDLLLWWWGRLGLDVSSLEVFGDGALVEAWQGVGRR